MVWQEHPSNCISSPFAMRVCSDCPCLDARTHDVKCSFQHTFREISMALLFLSRTSVPENRWWLTCWQYFAALVFHAPAVCGAEGTTLPSVLDLWRMWPADFKTVSMGKQITPLKFGCHKLTRF
jgi:hypothetical protein